MFIDDDLEQVVIVIVMCRFIPGAAWTDCYACDVNCLACSLAQLCWVIV
jgi:hypothetical protein